MQTTTIISASELRKNIFSKFNINDSYILTYKNKKIIKNDSIPLSILFKDDNNPLLFINDNNTILPTINPKSSITINTNISQKNLLNIINSFFQSKYLPFNASINTPMKGIYNIKFTKPYLASEFLKYYNSKLYKNNKQNQSLSEISNKIDKENNKKEFLTVEVNKINDYKIYSPKISGSYNKLPFPKIKNSKKTSSSTLSMSDIVFNNDKNLALYKVIKEISKSDKNAEKIISSGLYKYHQSYINTISPKKVKNLKKNEFINDKYILDDIYEGVYSFPFMSQEEKYIREKFLDKKNWLNKKGFLVSVGKYKMKYNYIPNYVNATPSESPLLHKYRDVNKKRWINRNGFLI
jgi:hypothetical protein